MFTLFKKFLDFVEKKYDDMVRMEIAVSFTTSLILGLLFSLAAGLDGLDVSLTTSLTIGLITGFLFGLIIGSVLGPVAGLVAGLSVIFGFSLPVLIGYLMKLYGFLPVVLATIAVVVLSGVIARLYFNSKKSVTV